MAIAYHIHTVVDIAINVLVVDEPDKKDKDRDKSFLKKSGQKVKKLHQRPGRVYLSF